MSIDGLFDALEAVGWKGRRRGGGSERHRPVPEHAKQAIRAALDAHCPGWREDVPPTEANPNAKYRRRWNERRREKRREEVA